MAMERSGSKRAQDDSPRMVAQPSRRVARLALEDGSVFTGEAFGAGEVTVTAEVVFNTAMTGYQESLTDPSYHGQILVETFPLIGNTGVNEQDVESERVRVAGLVVRELAHRHSNYRAVSSLEAYLAEAGVLGLCGVDTRALTLRIRESGALRGVLTDDPAPTTGELVSRAREAPRMAGLNLVGAVACSAPGEWGEDLGSWPVATAAHPSAAGDGALARGSRPTVLVLDCGLKRNILRHLAEAGCAVRVIPPGTSAGEIIEAYRTGGCRGLVVSNGPGDPAGVSQTVGMLRELLGSDEVRSMPILGICLGHQLLALALGGRTRKMKFGHRGVNQPVLDRERGVVEITSQNHGFSVDQEFPSGSGVVVTHEQLNDGTVAGFRVEGRPVLAVQHHPEASPGPHDASSVIGRFVGLVASSESSGPVDAVG